MFGRKKEFNIRVCYYSGLQGFVQNFGCNVKKEGNVLVVQHIKPEIIVKLNISQINSLEILSERDFMKRYQNTDSLDNNKNKSYFVFSYTSSTSEEGNFVLWGTPGDAIKMYKFQAELNAASVPQSYIL